MKTHTAKLKLQIGRQHGAALIMSLVILVILTLLGIASMNTANLQLLMTGNAQYQTVALSRAEQVIREAEDVVDAMVAGGAPPAITDGYHNITAGNDPEVDLNNFSWPDNKTGSSAVANSKYIIEYSGGKSLPPTTFKFINGKPIAGDNVYVFRITARTLATRGAVRLVQSIYVTIDSPI